MQLVLVCRCVSGVAAVAQLQRARRRSLATSVGMDEEVALAVQHTHSSSAHLAH